MSLADFSLSNVRYASLGEKYSKTVSVQSIIPYHAKIINQSLPLITDSDCKVIPFDTCANLNEKTIQEYFSKAYCSGGVGLDNMYKGIDTHCTTTFMGDDLKPDIIVTNQLDCPSILGDYQVMFFVELKASNVNPYTNEAVGQAISYCIRLLELSSPVHRTKAFAVVTNLERASLVCATYGNNHDRYEIQRTHTSASLALKLLFFNHPTMLGLANPTIAQFKIKETTYFPTRYLGMGATGTVYATNGDAVIKFYYQNDGVDSLQCEFDNLKYMSSGESPPPLCLQRILSGSNMVEAWPVEAWPALLLTPRGSLLSPFACALSNPMTAFLSLWETIKYCRTMRVVHTDIRPENIVGVEDANQWMLIDFASMVKLPIGEQRKNIAYHGCVSTAAPSILRELANQTLEASGPYMATVSFATDVISFLRTIYLFQTRIRRSSYKTLLNLRGHYDFVGIIDWWEKHTSAQYQTFERECMDASEDEELIIRKVETYLEEHIEALL